MLANLNDHVETMTIVFSVAYNSDFYGDNVLFEETVPAGSVDKRMPI